MQVWKSLSGSSQIFQRGVVTIGNFDGLHLGHQCLLQKAGEFPGPRIVITFDPHPVQVLQPERGLKRLLPREDLIEQLPQYGTDLLLILPFTQEFAKLRAEDFLHSYLGKPFMPRHVVAGYDFAFGHGREGTLEGLRAWASRGSVQVDVVPPLKLHSEVVSSRRIRELILQGNVAAARRFLGRPFYLRGQVIEGAGRGARIGIPTLNQTVINETWPANGVYATRTLCAGESYLSVTNIGTNPTFEAGSRVKVETHLLSASVAWRGKIIDVQLIDRLRDERKFSGVEELKRQIQSDFAQAQSVLESAL